MKPFDSGVRYYTFATVQIGFPEDDICCYRCPLMGKQLGIDREICHRTGEILLAPKHTIGYDCPLKFENQKENNDGENV